MAILSGAFGSLAALLATLGLYGVMSYMIARRRKEIGIRMALGADRGRVIQFVLKETLAACGRAGDRCGAFAMGGPSGGEALIRRAASRCGIAWGRGRAFERDCNAGGLYPRTTRGGGRPDVGRAA